MCVSVTGVESSCKCSWKDVIRSLGWDEVEQEIDAPSLAL